ncbi:TPA: mannose-1-phosphate guanylyltransferase/mannose-6-phosphate isomerase [Escherichia coli]|nr:mannose-1-phosphate guanylyltransferase/mannose-6-phosphate isomerase [Escherichia coli]HEC3290617.1 mannose-1-phosphate guanylyltransferase/mannose-6-phosphate isomerase [Escherichia coli]
MLQNTINRIKELQHSAPIIICNNEHRFLVSEQLKQIGSNTNGIILEPCGRNTAPAIALAALRAMELEEDPVLLVLAADHSIDDEDIFINSILHAFPHALNNKLVTFGVTPSKPETGYGYIKIGETLINNAYLIESFKEKPNVELAEYYLKSGDYLWNSGIFLFKASKFLDELKKLSPSIYDACEKSYKDAQIDLDFIRVDKDKFELCPSDSIDYAVMEKTRAGVVIPLNASWSDVGSWTSLWDISEKDENGNHIIGDSLLIDSYNSYIRADNTLIAAIGLRNLVIVQTKDAILIAEKERVQDVKFIVDKLKKEQREEYKIHRESYKLWGRSECIDKNSGYLVNKITINPGNKIKMQFHLRRTEHWIILAGTAKVTSNNQVQFLTENQSIYIPIGVSHEIENLGKIPLVFLEIQSGEYLSEDDIIRVDS